MPSLVGSEMCIRDRSTWGQQLGCNLKSKRERNQYSMKKILISIMVCLMALSYVQTSPCPDWQQGVKACLANGNCCAVGFGPYVSCTSFDTYNQAIIQKLGSCLLYTSPSPRDQA
eukprot:TRINITY_DN5321_c0_g1_i9.p2 TRINITY_DN5321_c0_g1~~TRINITY_DN5321_c0_g1_i9.p2  ORF type:complete len:115 (-),score=24.65 TRINITY_DN5321_c0_g1_i9:91-435(-)